MDLPGNLEEAENLELDGIEKIYIVCDGVSTTLGDVVDRDEVFILKANKIIRSTMSYVSSCLESSDQSRLELLSNHLARHNMYLAAKDSNAVDSKSNELVIDPVDIDYYVDVMEERLGEFKENYLDSVKKIVLLLNAPLDFSDREVSSMLKVLVALLSKGSELEIYVTNNINSSALEILKFAKKIKGLVSSTVELDEVHLNSFTMKEVDHIKNEGNYDCYLDSVNKRHLYESQELVWQEVHIEKNTRECLGADENALKKMFKLDAKKKHKVKYFVKRLKEFMETRLLVGDEGEEKRLAVSSRIQDFCKQLESLFLMKKDINYSNLEKSVREIEEEEVRSLDELSLSLDGDKLGDLGVFDELSADSLSLCSVFNQKEELDTDFREYLLDPISRFFYFSFIEEVCREQSGVGVRIVSLNLNEEEDNSLSYVVNIDGHDIEAPEDLRIFNNEAYNNAYKVVVNMLTLDKQDEMNDRIRDDLIRKIKRSFN